MYGPRYTSYPTALQFNESFDTENYLYHVEHSNQDPVPKPLSLYLHIPFCKSLCFYCGCHKIITNNKSKAQDYLDILKQEVDMQGKLFAQDRQVNQIHFGGGTPTYFNTAEIEQLMEMIRKNFKIKSGLPHQTDASCEVAIEIDPRTTSTNDINALAKMGFNRMSFGIQDFDHQVQEAINRIQSKSKTLELLNQARLAGVKSLSVDLIYGLPKQTTTNFCETLNAIIIARPDRIALYNYAHMPHLIKSQKLINQTDIPTAEEKLKLMKVAIEKLTDAGYQYIGMDHFALPNDPLSLSLTEGNLHRNFQGYSTNGDCDTIGIGVSSISKIGDSFSQNHKNLNDYQEPIKNGHLAIQRGYTLSQDDRIRNDIIQRIMCSQTINFKELSNSHQILFKHYFEEELQQLKSMADDGLLKMNQDELSITEKGRLLLRNIAMVFDVYLQKTPLTNQPINFSKLI